MRCELRRVLGVRLSAGGREPRNKPSAFPRVVAVLHRPQPAGRAAAELQHTHTQTHIRTDTDTHPHPPPCSPEEPLPKPASPRSARLPTAAAQRPDPRRALLAPGASLRALFLLSFLRSDREAVIACKAAIC